MIRISIERMMSPPSHLKTGKNPHSETLCFLLIYNSRRRKKSISLVTLLFTFQLPNTSYSFIDICFRSFHRMWFEKQFRWKLSFDSLRKSWNGPSGTLEGSSGLLQKPKIQTLLTLCTVNSIAVPAPPWTPILEITERENVTEKNTEDRNMFWLHTRRS